MMLNNNTTNKNTIVILSNNYDLLQAQIDNLPSNDLFNQHNCDYIICIESRIGTDVDVIKSIVKDRAAFIIDSADVVAAFANNIHKSDFLYEYTMGMNILLQWYMFTYYSYDKVLFTEDDVILTNNVFNIFTNLNKCAFYIWKTLVVPSDHYARATKKTVQYYDEFSRIFNLHINKDNFGTIWNSTHLSSGQRLYVRDTFDMQYYIHCLIEFFDSTIFRQKYASRKTHRYGYLDERFEGFYAYSSGILNNDMKPYTSLEIGKPKIDFNKYNRIKNCGGIWHNATVNNKLEWIKQLKSCGKLR